METKRPEINAQVRKAIQQQDGSWITVELGCARAVFNQDPAEDLKEVAQLGIELMKRVDDVIGGEVSTAAEEPVYIHFCNEHGVEFTRRENQNGSWYSHALGNGKYCKEPTYR